MKNTLTHSHKQKIKNTFDGAIRELEFTSQEVDRILSIPYQTTPIEDVSLETWVRMWKILQMSRYLPALLGRDPYLVRQWFRAPNRYLEGRSAIDCLTDDPEKYVDYITAYLEGFMSGDFT